MATFVRHDVYGLAGPWHPVLRAYALAIGEMRALPAGDPRSLAYQASVHGVGNETDPPPDQFRSQCQHNCWYFLPWHRWYLYYFEQTVRSFLPTIPEVPEDVATSWALPYWDYGRATTRKLPPEFASTKLWDGRPNPLYDATRQAGVNQRTAALAPVQTVPGPGVLQLPFSDPSPLVATFGGSASGWHHFREPGAVAGGLEGTPHNDVHGFVGGDMWRFSTAGLDPVFWLHHCNIDRYWEVRGHSSDPAGWANVPFNFRTPSSTTVQVNSDGCVDTVGQLGYRYENITAPPTRRRRVRPQGGEEMVESVPPERTPEVVGSSGDVHLLGGQAQASVEMAGPSAQFEAAGGGEPAPQRIFLTVTDITGTTNPGVSYGVYVGGVVDDEHLAGLVSFFGIEGTAQGGHGLGYTFDVTDIVHALQDDGQWDPANLRVVFEPVGPVRDEGAELESVGAQPEVVVGSVKVVFQ